MSLNPMISCLCITKNSAALLSRAIECFEAQTYPFKELLVIYESDNTGIDEVIAQKKGNKEIHFIEVPAAPKQSLGELRNYSIELAKGELFCQWDDDDWYAANRLEEQLRSLQLHEADVCFLGYWIIYDHTDGKAYISFRRNWEGTVLAKKSIINEACCYAALPKAEDTAFKEAVEANYKIDRFFAPHLYIYTYHGNNTWDYPHFQKNFELGEQLSTELAALCGDILSDKYDQSTATKLLQREAIINELKEKMIAVDLKTGVDIIK